MKTPEQIAKEYNHLSGRANIIAINKAFRAQDDSKLFPINGRFNATMRAIKRLVKIRKEVPMEGLEYALSLDKEIINIVNNPKLL